MRFLAAESGRPAAGNGRRTARAAALGRQTVFEDATAVAPDQPLATAGTGRIFERSRPGENRAGALFFRRST
jgi:hypothetical protein